MPPIPPLDQTLTDGRVTLREYAERDIPEILIAYQDDPDLHLGLGERRPPSGAELGQRAEQAPVALAAGEAVWLTILESGSDECRGQAVARDFDWEQARAEVAIWLAPPVRGQGLASRALRLFSSWLFAACRLERLQLFADPENQPMLRAAGRAGYSPEGTLRAYRRLGRRRTDAACLSLLPGEV